MKRVFTLLVLITFTVSICSGQENYKDFIKERKDVSKFTKEQLKEKASKDARKESKRLKKEGWKVAPGSLPLEKQLDRVYTMQFEMDLNTGFPKFIKGEAMSTGGNYDAAKMQAINLAKIELAGNIQTEVMGLIENRVGNKQLSPEEAESTSESVMGAKNAIAQSIGQTIVALEIYRDLHNKNKEVRVIIMYNAEMAKTAAKKAIREDLEKKADNLVDQLDNILGF